MKGYIPLWTPAGEVFYMPPGGDVKVYLRKGFTLEAPVVEDPVPPVDPPAPVPAPAMDTVSIDAPIIEAPDESARKAKR